MKRRKGAHHQRGEVSVKQIGLLTLAKALIKKNRMVTIAVTVNGGFWVCESNELIGLSLPDLLLLPFTCPHQSPLEEKISAFSSIRKSHFVLLKSFSPEVAELRRELRIACTCCYSNEEGQKETKDC
ncbi:uncharacterized protein LOC129310716 [Prosopis cineraria]|uniref:uncharacterized protein LOC129310716 n=1 Tax=Prosopis cineraria TaxID=364024 RepID=UPI00240F8026|nr:uncharacterized protein LOC129310716 [Prosopis cineraria]